MVKTVSITCSVSTDNLTDAEDAAKMMSKLFSDLVLRGFDVHIMVESKNDIVEIEIDLEDPT